MVPSKGETNRTAARRRVDQYAGARKRFINYELVHRCASHSFCRRLQMNRDFRDELIVRSRWKGSSLAPPNQDLEGRREHGGWLDAKGAD
ncbi:hypothetical protein CEXT_347111 [Caerostris extrusa]|uniref:Uncharacterized protein n=1 Tax=Caerostris extrusa TaxID=172846 RepID=A0AAV4VJR1_CAEEX|nr:hypothetical protein CEXT_347111 [Caerostris extrusa]